jgi:hypothetical protein
MACRPPLAAGWTVAVQDSRPPAGRTKRRGPAHGVQ